MGGKGGSPQQQVTEYYMSMHMGICSQADALTGLYYGEKAMWEGVQSGEGSVAINNSELFGGVKKEGGVRGVAYYLPGGDAQVMPEGLATRLGKTTATCPGFRGLSSVFFAGQVDMAPKGSPLRTFFAIYGFGSVSSNGFYWGANSPYLRDIWARARRTPKGLSSAYRVVTTTPYTVNPAHMIYECLRNVDWGMGAPAGIVDQSSFEAAGKTLYDEGFGLAMMWTRQASIESFVSEILDHIQATLYINPRTGKFTLKLLRDDYVEADLFVLTPDNCRIKKFARKTWGETANEIVATWTNPVNEQEETVTVQDLANISVQGPVSDSRNYYGVRTSELATRLAKRDIQHASAPLATFEIEANREAWTVVPGDCVKLFYPEHGINGVVLRLSKVDYGKPGSAAITLSAMEDIFGQPSADYTLPETGSWIDPSSTPEPMNHVRIITVPMYFAQLATSVSDTADLIYPEVFAAILAAPDNDDTDQYELVSEGTDAAGNAIVEALGLRSTVSSAILLEALPAEAQSLIAGFPGIVGPVIPTTATFMFIGDTVETASEVAMIRSVDGSGFVVDRGILDTTPKAWPIGTRVFFIDSTSNLIDETPRSVGETVEYQLLSRTSKGMLDPEDAPVESGTLGERPYLPNRPANVKVNTTAFGTIDATVLTTVDITWANRNRINEPIAVLKWTDGNTTPEVGQTTTVTLMDEDRTVVSTIDGLTGTSYTLNLSAFGLVYTGIIRVTSKVGGYESLQGHEITILVREKDYLALSGDEAGNRLALTPNSGNLLLGEN